MTNLKRFVALLALPAALLVVGCDSDDGNDDLTCADLSCDANACQVCDDTGAEPVCVSSCGADQVCNAGVCEDQELTCDPACDANACEECDTATGQCVSTCGETQVCNAGVCEDEQQFTTHAEAAELAGPFADGSSVTTACLECHQDQADAFMQTAHWNWAGPTPNLVGHETDTTVGKKNLINNFCIAIDSNEARCTQCHAGYGWGLPASDNDPTFDFTDSSKVDCLVCHSTTTGETAYKKDPKTAGNPAATVDLVAAAQSVAAPTVANCGACHFSAGGGDNVKKGDMGSALLTAANTSDTSIDVHIGSGTTCADCHAGENHTLLGQGIHIPVSEGRLACADCHTEAPHNGGMMDTHAQHVACQTCHIPAFSRQQPTKMSWDWSTAGDRGRTPVETTHPSGLVTEDYNWMKGDFVWEETVVPTYGWYNGTVTHLTIDESFSQAGTAEDPVVIAGPVATIADADARIFPFKVMVGRQMADASDNFLIVPDLFGPGGFWGVVGAETEAGVDHSYAADPALWHGFLTAGARAAGQITETDAYVGLEGEVTPAAGERAFKWVDTAMWMGIDHEVAPASEALGCSDCHGAEGRLDWQALGYSGDPQSAGGRQ